MEPPSWFEALNAQVFSVTSGGPIVYSTLGRDVIPSVVARLFRGVMNQEIILDSQGLLQIPDLYYIELCGGAAVYMVLADSALFLSLPIRLQKAILDVLFLLCEGGVYASARIRFQSDMTNVSSTSTTEGMSDGITSDTVASPCVSSASTTACAASNNRGIQHNLLRLLEAMIALPEDTESILVAKRVIRVFGALCVAGLSTYDLKTFLKLLRHPSSLTVALLAALKIMVSQDDKVKKAAPSIFFDFGGSGAGLSVLNPSFPFTREYHIAFWFRAEYISAKSEEQQHLLTIMTDAGTGIDMYIQGRNLQVVVRASKTDAAVIDLKTHSLAPGVWYKLSVQYFRPRMSLFSRDSLTIHLDGEQVYQDSAPLLSASAIENITTFAIGKDFNGQMGPVLLFNEVLPSNVMDLLFKVTAGKSSDGSNAIDLLQSLNLGDRTKSFSMFSKLASGFHPSRVFRDCVIDLCGGRHARIGPLTQVWSILDPRDVLGSLGGVSVILPLFPRLVIENEYIMSAQTPTLPRVGSPSLDRTLTPQAHTGNLGTSLRDLIADIESDAVLCAKCRSELEMISVDYMEAGAVALLFSILGRSLKFHPVNQREMTRTHGVGMIEYAIMNIPAPIIHGECKGLVLAILEFQTAVQDVPAIEIKILKHILCNMKIWSRSPFSLLNSIIGAVLGLIRTDPERFLSIMGVQWILDCIYDCFRDNMPTRHKVPAVTLQSISSSESPPKPMASGPAIQEIGSPIMVSPILSPDRNNMKNIKPSFKEEEQSTSPSTSPSKSVSSSEKRRSKRLDLSIQVPEADTNSESRGGDENSFRTPMRTPGGRFAGTFIRSVSLRMANSTKVGKGSQQLAITETTSPGFDDDDEEEEGSVVSSPERSPRVDSASSISAYEGAGPEAVLSSDSFLTDARMESSDVVRRFGSFEQAADRVLSTSNSLSDVDGDKESSIEAGSKSKSMSSTSFDCDELLLLDSSSAPRMQRRRSKLDEMLSRDGSGSSSSLHLSPGGGNNSTLRPAVVPSLDLGVTQSSIDAAEINSEHDDVFALTSLERLHLRSGMLTMLTGLLHQGASVREVVPIVNFIASCDDQVVLYEVTQLLLCSLVEIGTRVATAVIEACQGPEEFASFIITRLVDHPKENVRCTGIRLLTHFYVGLINVPAAALSLRFNRNRNRRFSLRPSKLSRARDSFLISSDALGLTRLEACGGLALVWKILEKYTETTTEMTYAAMLEMLLTTSHTNRHVTLQYRQADLEALETNPVVSRRGSLTTATGGLMSTPGTTFGSLDTNSRDNSLGAMGLGTNVMQRALVFKPTSSDHMFDDDDAEQQECTLNRSVLSLFFHFLPKFPTRIHEVIYMDLLGVLKHNKKNLEAFYSHASWNLCMYDMVRQLIGASNESLALIQSADICSVIEGWALYENQQSIIASAMLDDDSTHSDASYSTISSTSSMPTEGTPSGKLLRQWKRGVSQKEIREHAGSDSETEMGEDSLRGTFTESKHDRPPKILEEPSARTGDLDVDVSFDLAVKIYATVLINGLDNQGGWKEVQRTISLSHDSPPGIAVNYAVFSHLLNEMTFTMRSKYKEINKMAQSKSLDDNVDATNKLENLLVLLLLISEFLLETQPEVTEQKDSVKPAVTATPIGETNGTSTFPDPSKPFENTAVNDTRGNASKRFSRRDLPALSVDTGRSEKLLPKITPGKGKHNHRWIDLRPNAGYPPHIQGLCGVFEAVSSPASTQSQSSLPTYASAERTKREYNKEVLGPLGRNFEFPKGRMILVLQTLRLFDLVFWPNEKKLRNSHLLNFDRTVIEGAKAGQLLASDPEVMQDGGSELSVHSATVRLGLYVMSTLSPFSEMAELNVRRLRLLIRCIGDLERVSSPTTSAGRSTVVAPVNESGNDDFTSVRATNIAEVRTIAEHWVLVILAYSVKTLQRLSSAFEPIFAMIGMVSGELSSATLGFGTSGEYAEEDNEFERILADVAVVADVHALFNTISGRRIIEYIGSVVSLLVDVYEIGKAIFAESLGDREFRMFTLLVQRHQNTQLKLATFLKDKSIIPDETAGTEGNEASLSFGSKNTSNIGNQISRRLRTKSSSFDYFSQQNIGPDTPIPRGPQRSMSFSAKQLLEADQGVTRGIKPVEESFGRDVLALLRSLRDPFLKIEVMKNSCILGSIGVVETCEMKWTSRFMRELRNTRSILEELRDVDHKVIDEAEELLELSKEVAAMVAEREQERLKNDTAIENVRTKNAAKEWYNCMRRYANPWSPWHEEPVGAIADCSYEQERISAHVDLYKRRMTLVPSAEIIDHSDAAYYDARLRDQRAFEEGLEIKPRESQYGGDVIAISNSSKFLQDTKKIIIPATSTVANVTNDMSSWGEADIDDINGTSLDSKPTAGLQASDNSAMSKIFGLASNETRPNWTMAFEWDPSERIVFSGNALQIKTEGTFFGKMILTTHAIYFHPKSIMGTLNIKNLTLTDRAWSLMQLQEAYGRRYLLQNCGIELFFIKSHPVFFAFSSLANLQLFFRQLRRQNCPLLSTPGSLNPRHVFQDYNVMTELWRRRSISNFEYIMYLNVLAGRSYNDVTQYPVFPWIIKDYSSPTLDLNDPNIYRDLSKPVGALNEVRLWEIIDRFKSLDGSDGIPPFMYGSHYSSAGVVLHYLLRQEPFSTLAIGLQGGRLDCPDRLFFDIASTWDGCNKSISDVKELIPEFYCLPEFLVNSNKLPLGDLQDDRGTVNHVILPPWASSPYDFVATMRKALESDYVSEHLHEWIDLIFGYKQTGPDAIAANNVFYYLTYEGSVHIDAIEDPHQREATKAQVIHFGQTPSQLLTKEHTKRLPKGECALPILADSASIERTMMYVPQPQRAAIVQGSAKTAPIVAIHCGADKITVVYSDLVVVYFKWAPYPDNSNMPLQLKLDKTKVLPAANIAVSNMATKSSIPSKERERVLSVSRETEGRASIGESVSVAAVENNNDGYFFGRKSLLGGFLGKSRSNSNAPPPAPITSPTISPVTETAPTTRSNRDSGNFSRRQSLDVGGDINVNSTSTEAFRVSLSPIPAADVRTPTEAFSIPVPQISSSTVAMTSVDGGSSRIFTCCYWDSTIKINSLDNMRELVSSTGGHIGPVTCLQTSPRGHLLITGGSDATCRVWILESLTLARALVDSEKGYCFMEDGVDESVFACIHVLWGHDAPISAMAYSVHHDLLLSGSTSGLLVIHFVNEGKYVRSISRYLGKAVSNLLLSNSGYLIVNCGDKLGVFWINGEFLHEITLAASPTFMILSKLENVLICGFGNPNGHVKMYLLPTLEQIHDLDVSKNGAVNCLSFTPDWQYLMIGSSDGTINVCFDPEGYYSKQIEKQRLDK